MVYFLLNSQYNPFKLAVHIGRNSSNIFIFFSASGIKFMGKKSHKFSSTSIHLYSAGYFFRKVSVLEYGARGDLF
ncbi:hypothetical protein GDO81_002625 [Engystomops pustulosus]|uniref:Uncharacterized protein n=1 Tax=Engystomops pustulosus TaxID=76066 RepID=A0AAV7DP94_ENGPU|nr:hypothetical protein GDO81_002625 [Engystomops pustulosus]